MPSRTDLQARIERAAHQAIVDFALSNPDLRLQDLMEMGGASAGSITVGELSGSRPKRSAPRSASSTQPGPVSEVNTRTQKGRSRYDADVLAYLKGKGWLSANEVRGKVGGTALQFRSSVDRLIAADKVVYRGKARGTRYKAK